MPRKHVKSLIAHTIGRNRSRSQLIQQFSVSGLFADSGTGTNSGVATQAVLGGLTSGLTGGAGSDIAEQIVALSKHLNDLRTAQQTAIDTTNENTRALVQNTVTKATGSPTPSTAGSLISGIFGSTFGLSPIVKGLLSLFGGSSTKTVQPLVPFALPPSIQYQGGFSTANGGQVAAVDYAQNGSARVSTPVPATNVQIQVNAMDSRSFLDHSADIASAVREAMLHSNSLNDVIADL